MILKIFHQYIPFRKLAFVFLEGFFVIGMVYVGAFLRFYWEGPTSLGYEALFLKALLIAVIAQLCLYYFDLYDLRIFKSNFELTIRLLQSLGVASIVLAFLYYLFPDLIIGRGVFFISLSFIAAMIVSWRLLYNGIVKTKKLDQRVLIVGCGSFAQLIARMIKEREDSGFKVIGFINEGLNGTGGPIMDPSVLGSRSQLVELVEKEKVDRIIVALDERRGKFPDVELLGCKMKGIGVEDGNDFFENLTGRLLVESLTPSFLIFSEGFNSSRLSRSIKRAMELLVSFVGMIVLLPFFLIISVLIKFEDGGTIFYKQERVGENGKIFNLLKFRSMIENAEVNGPVWSQEHDTRVTRIGRWIRKCRLDEIPQMINVLKGDMSFIGPRPERPVFVEQLKQKIPYYGLRSSVKPGITGWAQIRYPYGASEEDALEKLKYDLYYLKNLSILFDIRVLFETIKVVLFGKGAR
jgi:sugar transferase (PEP-CTERM system associated)